MPPALALPSFRASSRHCPTGSRRPRHRSGAAARSARQGLRADSPFFSNGRSLRRDTRCTRTSRSARSQRRPAAPPTAARVAPSMKAPPPVASTWNRLTQEPQDDPALAVRDTCSPRLASIHHGLAGCGLDLLVRIEKNGRLSRAASRRPILVFPRHQADEDDRPARQRYRPPAVRRADPAASAARSLHPLRRHTPLFSPRLARVLAYRAACSSIGRMAAGNASCRMGKLTIALVVVVVLFALGGAASGEPPNPPAPAPVERCCPMRAFPSNRKDRRGRSAVSVSKHLEAFL